MDHRLTGETDDRFARLQERMAAQEEANADLRVQLGALQPGSWARHVTGRRQRWQKSAILALLLALVPLSLYAANPFTDLTGGVHDPNIDAIYNAGITTGCVPNAEYCPTANVTREEMASFLARLGGLGVNPPVANAKTAQTAANASRLDGTPAVAFAQKSQFRGTEVLDASGPLPKSGSFTSNGGTLVIFVSGSAYRGSAGLMGIELDITGPGNKNNATALQVYTNESLSHKAFPSEVEIITDLPAGNYTFTLKVGPSTTLTDPSDRFTISVLEIPKP